MRVKTFLLWAALSVLPALPAVFTASNSYADDKDIFADKYAGQILFLRAAPPDVMSGTGWFDANQITSKDENSDKKWVLNTMIFLREKFTGGKLDLLIYKIDKAGVENYVQSIEEFPNQNGRSFLFLVTLKKGGLFDPNLKYRFQAVQGTKKVASGTIELRGKEEKDPGSGNLDFGSNSNNSNATDPPAVPSGPFDPESAKKALKDIDYIDCRTVGSPGGDAKLEVTFSGKDGKVVDANFSTDPACPYSDKTQVCIIRRFKKAKMKSFITDPGSPNSKVVVWKINL
jgi:hypothetical protein